MKSSKLIGGLNKYEADLYGYLNSVTEDLVGFLSRDLSEMPPIAPPYLGPYEAIPNFSEQVLATTNKLMLDDVTVHEVPIVETINPSGGYTVIIGG